MLYQYQRLLSQNILATKQLTSKLVGRSSIGKNDIVIEIGPGTGMQTSPLLKKAKRVIGVEIDSNLINYLNEKFQNEDNLALIYGDFRDFPLPNSKYKVFANIPFSLESKIIRKLIDASNPPTDSYLVIRKSLAQRLGGFEGNNQFFISNSPFFKFSIEYYFKGSDFSPRTKVRCVLFRFCKKDNPNLAWPDRFEYAKFVKLGYTNGNQVFKNLSSHCPTDELNLVFSKLNIRRNARPRSIIQKKWIELYKLLYDTSNKC